MDMVRTNERIGFVIRGDYDPTVTYDFLEVVYYNGSSYVCKSLTTGNEPADNNEFWHIFARGATISNSNTVTTPGQYAADAVQLNPDVEGTLSNRVEKINTDLTTHYMTSIRAWLPSNYIMNATDFSNTGFYNIETLDETIEGNAPNNNPGDYKVLAFNTNSVYQILILTSPRMGEVYIGSFWDKHWGGWREVPTANNISRSTSVTVEGQKVLDAIENNPSIPGTLASELAKSFKRWNNYGVHYFGTEDVNEWRSQGSYSTSNYTFNLPPEVGDDKWGTMVVLEDMGKVVQIFCPWHGKGILFSRNYFFEEEGWTDWKKILNTSSISTSSAVTVTGQYALDAREKNPSIAGTLANGISQINSDLAKLNNSLTDSFVISGLNFHVEYSIGNDLFNIWANGNTNAGINASSWTSAHTLKGNMVAKMQEKNQPYRFGIMQIHTYRGITSIRWYINSSGSVAYYVISGEIYANENVQASVVF